MNGSKTEIIPFSCVKIESIINSQWLVFWCKIWHVSITL